MATGATSTQVPYSALKDDLFLPCKQAAFFSAGVAGKESSLCAELARLAYCRPENDFAFDQAKINAELNEGGFTSAGFFESRLKPNGEGAHCFIAVRNDNGLAVVAFRGTDASDPTDVAADLDARRMAWNPGGTVHEGFANFLKSVRAPLEEALRTVHCRILYTGHSLGAAMATLLASLRPPDALYTIGSPLVGDPAFVATLNPVKNYRYVDCCDIVTQIPPEVLGYAHAGKPFYIDQRRNITFDPAASFVLEDRTSATLEYPFQYHAWKRKCGRAPARGSRSGKLCHRNYRSSGACQLTH